MSLKYRILYERLSAAIDSGEYGPGEKLPTEAEMSLWGFSRNTVRQALALLENERRIIKQRGSTSMVKPLHRHGSNSGNVAVLAPDFSTTVFPQMIEGIIDGLYGWGTPLLYSANGKIEEEERILRELQDKDVEGLIANGLYTALPNPNIPLYRQLIEKGMPVVFALSHYAGLRDSIYVINDDVNGGVMAINHLYEQGRRKPCGIFTSDFIFSLARYEGYTEECRRLGIDVLTKRILWMHSKDYQIIDVFKDRVLELADGCDCMVCTNDVSANAAAKVLTSAGKRIPDDIAIVSFDNTYICDFPPVPLTSLDGNPYGTAKLAATKLKNILAGKHETSAKLPWTLVKRESS